MEMAKAGKNVILLEKGRDHQWIGNPIAALRYTDKMGFGYTKEGINVIRGITTGGSTILYCGSAAPPPDWFQKKHDIDLSPYVAEGMKQARVNPLLENQLGASAKRMMEAANSIDGDHTWTPLDKFMDPAKASKFDCGPDCMLGCKCGAKWTAREFIDEAKNYGAQLITRADVIRVEQSDGVATGVLVKLPGEHLRVEAKYVVIAAGGLGSPVILQRSGLEEAGQGMYMDPTVMVYGVSKDAGTAAEPPMTVACEYPEHGFMLSNLLDPWIMFPVTAFNKGLPYLKYFMNYKKIVGLMIKVKDDLAGYVSIDGEVSKPLTDGDWKRMNHASTISNRILIEMGCDPASIWMTPVRGTHPTGTCRIGHTVDNKLETRIKNLFVADGSVVPEALDRPVVLTAISLGKYCADVIKGREGLATIREQA
jgi:choline dehydrogenase-like flavoprotein